MVELRKYLVACGAVKVLTKNNNLNPALQSYSNILVDTAYTITSPVESMIDYTTLPGLWWHVTEL